MAAAIEAVHRDASIDKVPGAKGDFIVTVNGHEIWNKNAHPEGRFPEHHEILAQLAPSA